MGGFFMNINSLIDGTVAIVGILTRNFMSLQDEAGWRRARRENPVSIRSPSTRCQNEGNCQPIQSQAETGRSEAQQHGDATI